jgi:hypothetical protein
MRSPRGEFGAHEWSTRHLLFARLMHARGWVERASRGFHGPEARGILERCVRRRRRSAPLADRVTGTLQWGHMRCLWWSRPCPSSRGAEALGEPAANPRWAEDWGRCRDSPSLTDSSLGPQESDSWRSLCLLPGPSCGKPVRGLAGAGLGGPPAPARACCGAICARGGAVACFGVASPRSARRQIADRRCRASRSGIAPRSRTSGPHRARSSVGQPWGASGQRPTG